MQRSLTGVHSRLRSSRLSPSRGRDSREERRCARSQSRGLLTPRTVRDRVDKGALAVTRHAPPLPVCGLGAPGRGLLTAAGTAECARAFRPAVCSCDDCARDRLAVARPGVTTSGHTVPASGHVTALLFILSARGQGNGVRGLDGVTGIVGRLLLLPGIAATLGRRWRPSLRLQVAPSLFPRPLSRSLSGCSSACRGP